jgi:anti-sigma regulatory factor (Ser/Thr protein kinase)
MDSNLHSLFVLQDRTYQALVRSELKKLAITAGFEGPRMSEVEIIIAEITSNLVKHTTKGGKILARPRVDPAMGVEFIVIDEGPGMRSVSKVLEDGYSTKNTLGQGLGAIRRLSDEFDMYSLPGWGTIMYCCIFLQKPPKLQPDKFLVTTIGLAKKGFAVSGDGCNFRTHGYKVKIAMIDGLGHGSAAHVAATTSITSLKGFNRMLPTDELKQLHIDLKKTRGAVITIAHIDRLNKTLLYSGVGNISMKVITPVTSKGCFSYNGIVGHIMPASLNDHSLSWADKDVLVMHSDGISSRWDTMKYPGILLHHPVILCAALYKDHDRGNDDSTVLVGKYYKSSND